MCVCGGGGGACVYACEYVGVFNCFSINLCQIYDLASDLRKDDVVLCGTLQV